MLYSALHVGILGVYHWIFIVHNKLKVNGVNLVPVGRRNRRHMTSRLTSTEYEEYPKFPQKAWISSHKHVLLCVSYLRTRLIDSYHIWYRVIPYDPVYIGWGRSRDHYPWVTWPLQIDGEMKITQMTFIKVLSYPVEVASMCVWWHACCSTIITRHHALCVYNKYIHQILIGFWPCGTKWI